MRLVLFSDLHLDAPFSWAGPELGRRRRQGLRETLEHIVALADEVGADALVCGGDLYEHERATPDTGAFLRDTLGAAGRPVVVAPGNHDWYGPQSLYQQIAWPETVQLFTEPRLAPLELAEGLTLWGAAHCTEAGTAGFLDGFSVDRSGVNLALFHGSEQRAWQRQEEGKQRHAPFRAVQVSQAGLDHALLGHYHRPEDAEHHTYPGNPAPLTFGEDGQRGAVVVDIDGEVGLTRERHEVARIQAHDRTVDLSGCEASHEVCNRVVEALEGLDGVVRLSLHGELSPSADLRPEQDVAGIAGDLSCEQVVVRTDGLRVGYDLEALADERNVRGEFVRSVQGADLDADERHRVLVTGLRALEGRDDLEVS
jgi:DNA repair exonuclease SbcCD nuclease subunit